MKIAIDLIAKTCGVSKTTVSRVLNKHPYVKEDVRERVLAAMRKLDYEPRQLAVKKVVALAVAGMGSRMGLYEAALVSALTNSILKRGLGLRMQPAESFDSSMDFDLRCVISISLCVIPKLPKDGKLIIVNNVAKGVHSVHSDHAQGVALAVERLAEMGHERIGCLVGTTKGWGDQERLRGYRETMKKLKLPNAPELGRSIEESLLETIAKILLAKPTALIVGGEDNALQANHALRLLGKRVPEEISLVTFESPQVSKFLAPPNSTIDQGIEGIAEKAAEMAEVIVSGGKPELEIITENKFVERESTRER